MKLFLKDNKIEEYNLDDSMPIINSVEQIVATILSKKLNDYFVSPDLAALFVMSKEYDIESVNQETLINENEFYAGQFKSGEKIYVVELK